MKIKVLISARHIHLTKEALEVLFGKDYELEKRNDLTQPGEFASTATLTVQSDSGEITNVRILGPTRSYNQIEISKTDSYKLKLTPPVRESGNVENTPEVTLIGPKGTVKTNGLIIAERHLHLHPEDAEKLSLKDDDTLKLIIPGVKGGTLNNVAIKMSENYATEIHLDTDDANAHEIISGGDYEAEKEI